MDLPIQLTSSVKQDEEATKQQAEWISHLPMSATAVCEQTDGFNLIQPMN